jgi:hypothetical protein
LVQLVEACRKQGIKLSQPHYRTLDELVQDLKRMT